MMHLVQDHRFQVSATHDFMLWPVLWPPAKIIVLP
jgi:hypothetical protein